MKALRRLVTLVVLAFAGAAVVFVAGMRSKSPRVLNAVRHAGRATKQYVLPMAGKPGSPYAVVRHVGRKSGREYETPTQPIATEDGFAIALPYGTNTDWLQNVLAAGHATVVLDGTASEVDRPEIVSMDEANPLFPASQQRMHRLFRVEQCLLLRHVSASGDSRLDALRRSVDRLHALVAPMSEAELEAPAYPEEWRVADVLSHLGSGALIMDERYRCGLRGESVADDFAPAVWAAWNAKSSRAKASDALIYDRAVVDRLTGASADERSRVRLKLGPMTLDFDALVGMRVNEHTLHTWDVEVVGNPSAGLAPAGVPIVIDNLGMIARFTAKAQPNGRAIRVHTTAPERDFTITTGPDEAVGLEPGGSGSPDLTMPAEAFIRLVYGRLDPDHTPPVSGDPALLDHLRATFPGP